MAAYAAADASPWRRHELPATWSPYPPAGGVTADGAAVLAAWNESQEERPPDMAAPYTTRWTVGTRAGWSVPRNVPDMLPFVGAPWSAEAIGFVADRGLLHGWILRCGWNNRLCRLDLAIVDGSGLRTRSVPGPGAALSSQAVDVVDGSDSVAAGNAWYDGRTWLRAGAPADWVQMSGDGHSAVYAWASDPYWSSAPRQLLVYRFRNDQWGPVRDLGPVARDTVATSVSFDQSDDGTTGLITWEEGQDAYYPPKTNTVFPSVPYRRRVAVWNGDALVALPDPPVPENPRAGQSAAFLSPDTRTVTVVWGSSTQGPPGDRYETSVSRWDGTAWSPPAVLASGIIPQLQEDAPSVDGPGVFSAATSPAGDVLVAAFPGGYVVSDDAGRTWSAPQEGPRPGAVLRDPQVSDNGHIAAVEHMYSQTPEWALWDSASTLGDIPPTDAAPPTVTPRTWRIRGRQGIGSRAAVCVEPAAPAAVWARAASSGATTGAWITSDCRAHISFNRDNVIKVLQVTVPATPRTDAFSVAMPVTRVVVLDGGSRRPWPTRLTAPGGTVTLTVATRPAVGRSVKLQRGPYKRARTTVQTLHGAGPYRLTLRVLPGRRSTYYRLVVGPTVGRDGGVLGFETPVVRVDRAPAAP